MKQRLTSIDIRALVMTLRRKILSLRVANVYDISNKLYLFKLAAKGVKEFLLIEAGIRMHTTDFVRNKSSIPSGFTMKLRKHLRTKRIEDIRQVGIDRVVDITLGTGEKAYHILIEFYASGNLILTDHNYAILSLLRTHKYDEDTRCAVNEIYPFTKAANISIDQITDSKSGIQQLLADIEESEQKEANDESKHKSKKKKNKGEKEYIKNLVSKMVPFITPNLADHCLQQVKISDKTHKFDIENDDLINKIIQAAKLAQNMVKSLEDMETIPGYIDYEEYEEVEKKDELEELTKAKDAKSKQKQTPTAQIPVNDNIEPKTEQPEVDQTVKVEKETIKTSSKQEGEGDSDIEPEFNPDELFKGKRVKDFGCFQLAQMSSQPTMEFEWFDQCVDLYFTQIDKQKEQTRVDQKEADILKKMNRIKDDQLKRIEGLQKEADSSLVKAKVLQKNINEVQAIIEILHYLLNGIQWKEIWRMIKEEKRSGNPLANIIHSLDLEKQQATLIFNSIEMEQNENVDDFLVDLEENIIVKIDIDLTLSAQSNIQKYFEIKKKTQDKEERTKDKAHEAIKNAEDQARRALLKARNDQREKITRKPFWFEKFDWFISSENYLIISGRNAQQNEELVKTYLGKRDLYVHSEMAGSASCIIKNPTLEEVSPLTINECGIWAI